MPLRELTPPTTRPVRDGWITAVLPAGCRRVHVTGDSLPVMLREAGLVVVEGGLPAPQGLDAVVGDCPSRAVAVRFSRAAASSGAPLVLAAVCGGRRLPRERTARVWRALELATTPASAARTLLAARRAAAILKRAGLRVEILPTGDRSSSHAIGRSDGLRLPLGAIISASRGDRVATVLEAALAAAAAAIGAELRAHGAMMTDSGKLLVRVSDQHGRRFLLRLAGGSAGTRIAAAASATRALARPAVPAAVRERVVTPVSVGTVDGFDHALEAEVPGRHPRRISAALWEDCIEFLVALFTADGPPAAEPDALRETFEEDVQLVAPTLSGEILGTLQRLPHTLTHRLGDVPLGWAHGDFWPQNLLVNSGRLSAVIDWDDADASRLPLLDLLDLRGLSDPGTSRLTPGPRLEHVLRPLALVGGDERIRRYCAASGIPADPKTLEAFTVSWWLQRVAHDLRDCPDKLARPRWLEENVVAPLVTLAGSRW